MTPPTPRTARPGRSDEPTLARPLGDGPLAGAVGMALALLAALLVVSYPLVVAGTVGLLALAARAARSLPADDGAPTGRSIRQSGDTSRHGR